MKKKNIGLDVVTMLPFSYAKDYAFFCSINAPFPRLIFHCTVHTAICSTFVIDIDTVYSFKKPPFLYPPLLPLFLSLSLFYPYAFCCRNYEKLFPKCWIHEIWLVTKLYCSIRWQNGTDKSTRMRFTLRWLVLISNYLCFCVQYQNVEKKNHDSDYRFNNLHEYYTIER